MGRIQYEELPCPFCDKGRIACGYIPSVWSQKSHGKNALGSGKRKIKSNEEWLIQSGCSVCGKSQEEVEEKLKKDGII